MKQILLLAICLFSTNFLFAYPAYISNLPNGNVNNCANCHVNAAGGGSRNSFGQAFASNGRDWNVTLAKLDSDNDGFTNGQELQDPDGTWTSGGIGNPSLVTLPGNASSKPTSIEYNPFATIQLFPQPAKENLIFDIRMIEQSNLDIRISDISGNIVKNFAYLSLSNNSLNYSWDLTNDYGLPLINGIYFIEIKSPLFIERLKFIIQR